MLPISVKRCLSEPFDKSSMRQGLDVGKLLLSEFRRYALQVDPIHRDSGALVSKGLLGFTQASAANFCWLVEARRELYRARGVF